MLTPNADAQLLAEHMAGADAVHRQILEETIESGERGRMTESGRAACASVSNLKQPLGRFPRAVLLESCPPVQAAGIWHTHPGNGELREPRHSLPDWANVVLGPYDVSIVTGTRSVQVITAAEDEAAMVAAFQEAVGADVATKRDVIAALVRGGIDHDTTVRRVEAALSPLIQRRHVGFHDLDARVDAVGPAAASAAQTAHHVPSATGACYAYQELVAPDVAGLRAQAREASEAGEMVVRRIASQGFDEALGVIAGTIVSNWLFGR